MSLIYVASMMMHSKVGDIAFQPICDILKSEPTLLAIIDLSQKLPENNLVIMCRELLLESMLSTKEYGLNNNPLFSAENRTSSLVKGTLLDKYGFSFKRVEHEKGLGSLFYTTRLRG